MENPVRRGRATYFPNDIPGKGSPAELPGGGMPGPSGDKDINAGALPAPECPQHRDHPGGGKLPSPTVCLMLHAGPPTGPEQQAPGHSLVCQGSGAEEVAACGCGDEGEFRAGL